MKRDKLPVHTTPWIQKYILLSRREDIVKFNWCDILERAKQIYSEQERISLCLGQRRDDGSSGGSGKPWKGVGENILGAKMFYLNIGGGYIGVPVCSNTLNYTLQIGVINFIWLILQ